MSSFLLNSFKLISNSKLCNRIVSIDKLIKTDNLLNVNFTRSTSFFNKLPAEDLWRGVTSVSNAGKKRGRGRGSGRKIAKDLNRGQVIGLGKVNMLWPGLNAPIIQGNKILQMQNLPEDVEREKNIYKLRDSIGGFRVMKLSPIDRGWSGSKMPGRSIGRPDPVGEETFEGFDTRVLEHKIVFIMKGNLGRKRRYSVLTVTGNGNGLAGFALGKAMDARAALIKSKNRAAQKLMKIDLCENRTIYHDFYSAFGATKIFAKRKPEGYGLVCHRGIQTICKVLGIKDLHAKIEGSTNIQHIVKAFFIGLLQQRNHQQLADEKQMHLVEFNKAQDGLLKVLASPTVCLPSSKAQLNENLTLSQHILGDKVVLKKKKFPPFYVNTLGYQLYQRKQEKLRNQYKVRLDMLVHKGALESFLTKQNTENKNKDTKDIVQN